MRKSLILIPFILVLAVLAGCKNDDQEDKDSKKVDAQQGHYAKVQPVPRFDYSMPRDVLVKIYKVVTTEARATYTIVESMTGMTKFRCPSISYGIPADTSLTNPLRRNSGYRGAIALEQAEPNGLFSSKNTDGTWVLCVDLRGDLTPIYTEHKVTTFPFVVKKTGDGEWVRADSKRSSFVIRLPRMKQQIQRELDRRGIKSKDGDKK